MIGQQGINGADDICRYAANECGITGIDIPWGMLPNPDLMLANSDYRESVAGQYLKLGTPIVRLSTHTDGQLASLHSAYKSRFVQFAGEGASSMNRDELELAAQSRVQKALRLGHLLGIDHHQTFPGGRGVPHHDQWSTLPEYWHQYELMFLAMQWTNTFQVAFDNGQQHIGFEIGHVMESIQTVDDLELFRSYLPEHLRRLAKWGVDTSHYDKEEDYAVGFVDAAMAVDLDSPGHAKDAWYDKHHVGGRHRQNALPFRDQAGKFEVFGMGNPASAKKFAEVLWRAHKAERFSYGVIEGEAMRQILCPFQGMWLAAENLRRVIDGKDPIPMSEVQINPWSGPTFETFAKSGVSVSSLLELKSGELRLLCEMAERYGLPRPI